MCCENEYTRLTNCKERGLIFPFSFFCFHFHVFIAIFPQALINRRLQSCQSYQSCIFKYVSSCLSLSCDDHIKTLASSSTTYVGYLGRTSTITTRPHLFVLYLLLIIYYYYYACKKRHHVNT